MMHFADLDVMEALDGLRISKRRRTYGSVDVPEVGVAAESAATTQLLGAAAEMHLLASASSRASPPPPPLSTTAGIASNHGPHNHHGGPASAENEGHSFNSFYSLIDVDVSTPPEAPSPVPLPAEVVLGE